MKFHRLFSHLSAWPVGGDCVTDEAELRLCDSAHQEEKQKRMVARVRSAHLRKTKHERKGIMGKIPQMTQRLCDIDI